MKNGNDLTSVGVHPVVIKMLEKLQAYYHYKDEKKKSYGKIIEDLVTAEFSALGLELNGEKETEKEVRVVA